MERMRPLSLPSGVSQRPYSAGREWWGADVWVLTQNRGLKCSHSSDL